MRSNRYMAPAILIAAGLLILAGCAGQGDVTSPESFDDALALAGHDNSLVLVEFYTDW
ncbi:MAG: hypothetical protein IFK94_13365 [Acidobacteria bacterium]|uniref:Thioredoxin domain-containing protein n=1 Tax=Candidatus Polarisedimenticola svalbardensis TaxID=2886004 RepID=A0A8J7C2D6_9BACT|nr:hypothetical protein [Candidatus Polarisedimenticola svalbardensis]